MNRRSLLASLVACALIPLQYVARAMGAVPALRIRPYEWGVVNASGAEVGGLFFLAYGTHDRMSELVSRLAAKTPRWHADRHEVGGNYEIVLFPERDTSFEAARESESLVFEAIAEMGNVRVEDRREYTVGMKLETFLDHPPVGKSRRIATRAYADCVRAQLRE